MTNSQRGVTAVILLAAGAGERLGYGIPKAQVPLGGETILMHAIRGVVGSDVARQIVIAVPAGDAELRKLVAGFIVELVDGGPEITVVDGGSSRSDSVKAAMDALEEGTEYVLVHDAARALTPERVFQRVAAALADGADAVIPVIPVVDTVKTVLDDMVTGTVPREHLRAVQTPQGFDLDTLRTAHSTREDATDDAALVELLGVLVRVVPGSTLSMKITTPSDLILAEALLEGPLGARWVEG